jgi:diguanylate cyclase (GGDEF)-like protein/PAS domain S-box-containing protein
VGTQFETFHTLPNGKPLYLMVNTTPIFLDTGIQIAFVGVDITQRKQTEQALKQSERFFHDFFESNSSVMLLIEPVFGQLIDANRAAVTFYGYTREQLMAMYLCHINMPAQEQRVARSKQPHREDHPDLVHAHKLASGDVRYVEVYSTPIELADRAMLFSIIHDVTERYLLEKQVHQLAFHDALTQLPNRSLLNDRMTQIMAISHRSGCFCALMMVDLDNFKPINDLHGHLVGDLMLIEVARRLTLCVREVDTVARFGGDEFVVMLSELSTDKAESTAQTATVAEKIIQSLAEPYLLAVKHDDDTLTEYRCTASMGVLVFTSSDVSREDILNRADAAMYQAKNDGGNRIRFYATEGERERP